jgi:putative ABC transport system permease protein
LGEKAWLGLLKDGLQNLCYSKLRSFLALLGVLVGTASVVAMVLGGELATNEALKQFKSLGTDLLAVSMNLTDDNLTLQQALGLSHSDTSIVKITPYTQVFQSAVYEGTSLNGMILGVADSFAEIVNVKLKSGRFISFVDKYELYCVIGSSVYNKMKEISFKEPLGQQLQISKHIFVIVGVADAWQENSFVNANVDEAIMVPLLTSTMMTDYTAINNLIIKLTPNANIPRVEEHLSSAINNIISNKQITFRSAKELIAKMEKQSDILNVFLGLIGSISLIVGGIGVMNIMLVSVMERRREIGIRLAVGARRFDIGALFLSEAVLLSLVGGLLGVVIGIIIAYVISIIWQWQFTLYIWPPLAGFTVSVLIGIFFGFYPAYLASKLDPIEALRAE